jgi:hypothetical protein
MWKVFASALFALASVFGSLEVLAQDMDPVDVCDINGDGFVDVRDLSLLSKLRGRFVVPGSLGDAVADGRLTPADVAACIKRCTLSNCAAI